MRIPLFLAVAAACAICAHGQVSSTGLGIVGATTPGLYALLTNLNTTATGLGSYLNVSNFVGANAINASTIPSKLTYGVGRKLLVDAIQSYYHVYPLLYFGALRQRLFSGLSNTGIQYNRTGLNWFVNSQGITGVNSGIVSPNDDTIYSEAWVSLGQGPIVLTFPDFSATGLKFFSLTFFDVYQNVVFTISSYLGDSKGGKWLLYGPNQKAPTKTPAGYAGFKQFKYNGVYIFQRTLINKSNEAVDTAKALALQAGTTLALLKYGNSHKVYKSPASVLPVYLPDFYYGNYSAAAPYKFWQLASALLKEFPTPGGILEPTCTFLSELGITNATFDPSALSELQRAALLAAQSLAYYNFGSYSSSDLSYTNWAYTLRYGKYGANDIFNSAITRSGVLANSIDQAVYLVLKSAVNGANNNYVVHFAAGELASAYNTDLGFWSLTVYNAARFFYPNAINRYSIGDRTSGILYNADGSLDLYVQHTAPANATQLANWLPAPATAFALSLRLFVPTALVQSGAYEGPRFQVLPVS